MFEKLRSFIVDYVEMDEDEITPDTRFIADMHMNSLDVVTMIGELEDEFDITIETEDLHDIFTMQDLVEYIEERM